MGLWTAHKRKKEKRPVAIKGLPSPEGNVGAFALAQIPVFS